MGNFKAGLTHAGTSPGGKYPTQLMLLVFFHTPAYSSFGRLLELVLRKRIYNVSLGAVITIWFFSSTLYFPNLKSLGRKKHYNNTSDWV